MSSLFARHADMFNCSRRGLLACSLDLGKNIMLEDRVNFRNDEPEIIDLEKTTFRFQGQSIEGKELAKLLGLISSSPVSLCDSDARPVRS